MNGHERFESLAGAIVLDEATPEERAVFAAHATTCARCDDDVSSGTRMVSRVADARRAETWRPSLPIVDRIRERRRKRTRLTLGALGWGIAGSLVLNVAFAAGIGSQVSGLFSTISVPSTASSRLVLEAPRAPALAGRAFAVTLQRRSLLAPALVRPARASARAAVIRPPARPTASPAATLDDIPDLLADIELGGSAGRTVAVEALPRCEALESTTAARVADTSVRPCRDATGRIER